MKPRKRPFLSVVATLIAVPFASALNAQGDPATIERILVEGKENSQVWDTLTYLSEEIGVRLTGSTALQRASEWTRDEFERLGLTNAHLASWGTIPVRFDRGPSYARIVAPDEQSLGFTTRSWGAGTDGPVRGRLVPMPIDMEGLDAVVEQLDGAWLLVEGRGRSRSRRNETDEERQVREQREALQEEIEDALNDFDLAGRVVSSSNDLLLTSSVRGWRDLTMETLPTDVEVQITKSDYQALAGRIEAGEELTIEVDLQHTFEEGPFEVYNTVAEIRGTEKPDEVLIFSGHLDTWDGPGSEGAQDNGTGCAVMLEAARLLMAADAKPKRTIRFILWTGEEQGLFGSRAYVEGLSEEERAGISAVFVDDGGTNYQGGAQCIASMKPMLDAAIAPVTAAFPDLPMENVVTDRMPRGGGSDHAPFNQVGVPGFFWNETGSGGREGKNYTFIHHTQHDTMRYAVPEYLVQSAANSAVVAYQLAQAETMLPRQTEEVETVDAAATDPMFEVTEGIFSGAWGVALVGDDAPDVTFTVAMEMSTDGRLRGTLDGQAGKERIREGKWEGGKASFAVQSDFGKLVFETTVEDEALVGTMTVGGMKMDILGERQEAAPADAAIAGQWKGIITSMDADISMTFAVAADGALTGRFKSSQSDSELYDAKWDPAAGTVSFEYDYPHAGRLPVVAKLEGDKLVGTIGERADFEATRVSAP